MVPRHRGVRVGAEDRDRVTGVDRGSDHRYRSVEVHPPGGAAACSRARTACSAEACQKFASVVPVAAPAVSALAIAMCGSSQPLEAAYYAQHRAQPAAGLSNQ